MKNTWGAGQGQSPEFHPKAIDPGDAPRAVREYLEALDDTAFGAASPVALKFISHPDPASQWAGGRGVTCVLCVFYELSD